jgi:hypothetical protein
MLSEGGVPGLFWGVGAGTASRVGEASCDGTALQWTW